MIELWNESLFVEFPPAEQQRSRVDEARKRMQLLERLRHLIQRAAGKMSLSGEKALAVTAAALPQGYQFSLRERVKQARQRVTAFAKLEKAPGGRHERSCHCRRLACSGRSQMRAVCEY